MREIYEKLYDPLFQYIFYLTNNRVVAEEIVQDAFVKFFEKQHVIQPKAYLYRIARNLVYDYYRRKRLIEWLPLGKDTRVTDNFPQDLLEQNEMNRVLYEALTGIKIHYREAIVLRYIEELSVRETAELLGISETKVKNNTARGLQALRKLLGGDFDGAIEKAEVKTTDSVKEKHFKQIEARLSQDAPPKPAILPNIISVAVIVLVILLAVLEPSQEVTTDTGITKIYVNDNMDTPSHSKWYVGVKSTTNPKFIEDVENELRFMEPIDEPQIEHDINFRFTIFTPDGSKNYGLLMDGNYLIDIDTRQYYHLKEDEDGYNSLSHVLKDIEYEQSFIWMFFLLIAWLIGKSVIEKLYYPRDVDGHKLPRHSSKWQKVIYILTALTIVPMFYYPILMHYGLILTLVTLSILLQIWIETKTDNATWRKWMFLDHYWIVFSIYVIFGN